MQCATCTHWKRLDKDGGECRAHPPQLMSQLVIVPSHINGVPPTKGWERAVTVPPTPADFWCGEHKPKMSPLRREALVIEPEPV